MLQSVNIPSSPLPEVPTAQPGAPGDAGERAEFAQLLQHANAGPDTAPDAGGATPPADARSDLPARSNTARSAREHKPHDGRKVAAEHQTVDTDAGTAELLGRIQHTALTDGRTLAVDSVEQPEAPRRDAADAASAGPDAVLPTLMQRPEPLPIPMPAAQSALPSAGDERAGNGRPNPHIGGRELRLPTRADAPAGPNDSAITRTLAQTDAALPAVKDAALDAMHPVAGNGRGATPLLDRTPPELTAAAAQPAAFARELHHMLARTDTAAEATLRAAPDDAGFAPALGTQVAMWVKDGVQQARLHLHPAELGPVTVQIALEGQAAHVGFIATVAATRESIEQSLPALAAALREAGFTLTGGGVFGGRQGTDSGRERAPEGRGNGTRATAAIGSGDTETAAPLPRRWARSLVDVYA